MPTAGFKHTIPASKWPQTHAWGQATTRISTLPKYREIFNYTLSRPRRPEFSRNTAVRNLKISHSTSDVFTAVLLRIEIPRILGCASLSLLPDVSNDRSASSWRANGQRRIMRLETNMLFETPEDTIHSTASGLRRLRPLATPLWLKPPLTLQILVRFQSHLLQ